MRDHPIAALIGLLLFCVKLVAVTAMTLLARKRRTPPDPAEYGDDPYAW